MGPALSSALLSRKTSLLLFYAAVASFCEDARFLVETSDWANGDHATLA